MHFSYEDFQHDGGLLRFATHSIVPLCFDYVSARGLADCDSRCASYAKQTNTSSGSSVPGGGKPVDPPKGTARAEDKLSSAGSANDGGSSKS
ncbi:hypothetical protein ARMGADRAFT_1171021 [Armillaria gallica]|uniref:Uncharacterized protein n=1 Tax=Armillaria gallica TaxID=47427 RepID=A0A2H3D461_ARMGA|nr:hypothetical protein ARMGADRAFT_1171021 [Armillaria gallica]